MAMKIQQNSRNGLPSAARKATRNDENRLTIRNGEQADSNEAKSWKPLSISHGNGRRAPSLRLQAA